MYLGAAQSNWISHTTHIGYVTCVWQAVWNGLIPSATPHKPCFLNTRSPLIQTLIHLSIFILPPLSQQVCLSHPGNLAVSHPSNIPPATQPFIHMYLPRSHYPRSIAHSSQTTSTPHQSTSVQALDLLHTFWPSPCPDAAGLWDKSNYINISIIGKINSTYM